MDLTAEAPASVHWIDCSTGFIPPLDSLPECTDGHVTKTRTTTAAGTAAHYHVTEREGPDAFDEREE